MSHRRTRTVLHTNNSGEVSTYRIELPARVAEGSEVIDEAVRSAYLQGFSAGAQYSSDHQIKILALESQFAVPQAGTSQQYS